MDTTKIREIMLNKGIIFSFGGLISQDVIVSIVNNIKSELKIHGAVDSVINSIFLVVIEQMQNVMSYSKDKKIKDSKYTSQGITVIGFDELKQKYFVASSNKIKDEDKIRISDKIEKINSLDDKQLRKYSRELLRSGDESHDRGAGVGLVEMAKNSSEKLLYKFSVLNETNYFEIKVYI